MSSDDENGTFTVEISTVSREQYERWKEAAQKDSRAFAAWARVELDRAAEKQLAKGATQ